MLFTDTATDKIVLDKKLKLISYIMNGNNTIPIDSGLITIQEIGVVKSVENVDYYANVLITSDVNRVNITKVGKIMGYHINKLSLKFFKMEAVTYIRDYTIFVDDGIKEILTTRTVRYKGR